MRRQELRSLIAHLRLSDCKNKLRLLMSLRQNRLVMTLPQFMRRFLRHPNDIYRLMNKVLVL